MEDDLLYSLAMYPLQWQPCRERNETSTPKQCVDTGVNLTAKPWSLYEEGAGLISDNQLIVLPMTNRKFL